MSAAIEQRNQEATCYVGNLDEKVNDELLWELMLQCGPVVNVHMPKDKVTGAHQGYGFVEFRGEEDAEYAIKVMNMIKLHGKPLKVNKASHDKKQLDVGANIFIGNLDPDVDEKLLYDTFSAFGGITQTPKIMRDPDSGESKGYGFVSFDSFEASDMAIECMNGQFLCNRQIVCQYAFKKDTPGERHGSQAERLLAASRPQRFKPHTIFSGGEAGDVVSLGLAGVAGGMTMQMQQQQQLSAYAGGGYGYEYGYDYSMSSMQQQQGQGMGMGMGMGMSDPYGMMPSAPMSLMPSAPMSLPGYMSAPPPPLPYGAYTMPPAPPTGAMNIQMSMQMPPPPPPPPFSMGGGAGSEYDAYSQQQQQQHFSGFAQPPPPPPPPM